MSLIDNFNRTINYLRISVTDRCDFRCVYCMAEEMTFLPRSQVLTLEEAIRPAIGDVRSTGFDVERVEMEPSAVVPAS